MTSQATSAIVSVVDADSMVQVSSELVTKIRKCRELLAYPATKLELQEKLAILKEIERLFDTGFGVTTLFENVHPDEALRNAAELWHQELAKLSSELELDKELFHIARELSGRIDELDGQSKRFVERLLRDFRRAGVDRDDQTRERVKELKEKLVCLSQDFNRNIRRNTRFIELESQDALDGLPADYIESHPPSSNGKIRITTDYPDLTPFMSYAHRADRRKELHYEYNNRAFPENIEVLEEILKARFELARILGYESWASYITEDKMVRTAERIEQFVDEIARVSEERSARDYAALLERKRKDHRDSETVEEWERAYYLELVRAETLGFDAQQIRPYFEFSRVRDGVLSVSEKLFGLKYVKVEQEDGAPKWHESVETYDVFAHDSRIGRFYLDMHPREGKYKHAAMFPILAGEKGERLPEAALICNFPKPSGPSSSALLEHSQVVTFFHEFGHLLHHLLGGGQSFVRFSGTSTEWDFVEVPSQLFEEWAYSYEALRHFAVHTTTGETIPEELVRRLNRTRSFGRGIGVRQQMFYAALSLEAHKRNPKDLDTTALVREVQQKFSPYPHVEGTHLQASFGHLDGYSALYYTYMWSLVIARDLFGEFREHGLFDGAVADRYRRVILEAGGSRDAEILVEEFLGRGYNLDAYREWLHEGE